LPSTENSKFGNLRFDLPNIENSKFGNSRFGLPNIENSRFGNSRFGLPNIESFDGPFTIVQSHVTKLTLISQQCLDYSP